MVEGGGQGGVDADPDAESPGVGAHGGDGLADGGGIRGAGQGVDEVARPGGETGLGEQVVFDAGFVLAGQGEQAERVVQADGDTYGIDDGELQGVSKGVVPQGGMSSAAGERQRQGSRVARVREAGRRPPAGVLA
ncbi:hypothetical protein [Streptomyces sp. HPF1205]|uniref:hypothetical protein n=1 Tax=Streptomyces sp. HPF1205 TaxID=2873262 RepID=UPI001CEC6BC3|nr:hypothetical protein [Streptomyces sp. HPF1205]